MPEEKIYEHMMKDFERLYEASFDNNGEINPYEYGQVCDFVLHSHLTRVQQRIIRLTRMSNPNELLEMESGEYARGYEKALSEELSQAREEEQELLKLLN